MYSNLLHWQWYVTHTQTDSSIYCNKLLFQDEPPQILQTLTGLKRSLQSLFVSSEQHNTTYRQKIQQILQDVHELCSKSYDTMRNDISHSLSCITVSFKLNETLFSKLLMITL